MRHQLQGRIRNLEDELLQLWEILIISTTPCMNFLFGSSRTCG
jgi:hypothetical protein